MTNSAIQSVDKAFSSDDYLLVSDSNLGVVERAINIVDEEALTRILDAATDKKALDVKVLDVRGIHSLFDFLVLLSGSNPRQIRSIAEEVHERLKTEMGVSPRSVEGLRTGEWVLLDYSSITVHVFSEEARDFYGLERLWSDAKVLELMSA